MSRIVLLIAKFRRAMYDEHRLRQVTRTEAENAFAIALTKLDQERIWDK